MGRKEPGPYNPWKTWPGEAHKQPQLATQYYLRAQVEECLRIRNKVMTGDFPLHRFGIHMRKLGKKEPGQNNPEKGGNKKTRGQ